MFHKNIFFLNLQIGHSDTVVGDAVECVILDIGVGRALGVNVGHVDERDPGGQQVPVNGRGSLPGLAVGAHRRRGRQLGVAVGGRQTPKQVEGRPIQPEHRA